MYIKFIIFTLSVFVFSVTAFLPRNNRGRKNLTEVNENVYLVFYNGETVDQYESIQLSDIESLLKNKDFDAKHKKTVFYTPGFVEPVNASTTVAVLSSYLDTKQYNVIQVNWTKYSMAGKYLQEAVPSTYAVGQAVALGIEKLLGTGVLDRNTITIVGHSLGAQISGTIARNLKQPIPLVVGLDPAGPGYGEASEHLRKGDAQYVLVIHTDVGVYGTRYNDGDLDLHMNSGIRPQPECTILSIPFSLTEADTCSHQKSTFFWANIVRYPGIFKAIDCDSAQFLRIKKCDKSKPITISQDMQGITGVYYLRTGKKHPYGLGLEGI
ncbi:phospholipase A1 VesT1.02-like [Chrysoperla carnea]|uniref:phospholipase A1 VesT1.02-like n=1 Tax=Chrysoperla carnea TaxID=189513 RepID=UPI001D0987FD|nr:phospholipase A1 VesT1.02-like [Chrysoperla carnea]